jgi:transposase
MLIWVGIDVSKDTLDCGWFEKGERKHFQVANNSAGFAKLLAKSPSESRFVMEATGSYFLNLALFLSEKERYVSVENPIRIKNHMRSDLRRSKSDKSDAFAIAKFGMEKTPIAWEPLNAEVAELRQLFALRDMMVSELTRLKNQKHAFTSSKLVSKTAVDRILKMLLSRQQELCELNKEIQKHQAKYFAKETEIVMSIPGVGMVTAGKIISSVIDFNRFQTSRHLVSYLGLTPTTQQSGTSVRSRGVMSKMGGSRLRQDLYFCAISASRFNPSCIKMYERMKEKGKPSKVILVAIMNKIIRQAYAMIQSGSMYDPNLA